MGFNIGKALGFGGLFGLGDDSESNPLPPPPSYFEDPNYRASQDFLQPYGQGLLTGDNIPDFYKSIGMSNSPEFQNILALSNRDIQQSAAEAAARTGRGRGGSLPSVTAQAIGDNSAKLRYADFVSSNAGKQFLMTQGRGITEGVRSAGQTEGANRNTFNLGAYDRTISNTKYQNALDAANADAAGKAFGKMLPLATTVAGGIGGFFLGGPAGAMTGAQLGQSLGGAMGGSTTSVLDIFKSLPGSSGTDGKQTTAADAAGTSNIGRIGGGSMSADELMKLFKLNSN